MTKDEILYHALMAFKDQKISSTYAILNTNHIDSSWKSWPELDVFRNLDLDNENINNVYNMYDLNYFSETLMKQNNIKKQLADHVMSHSEFLKYLGGLDE